MSLEGFYINLENRTDRRQYFEEKIKSYPIFSNIQRMDAIYNETIGLGCTLSHIRCLKQILQSRQGIPEIELPTYYAIMEDDFSILNVIHFNDFLQDFEIIKQDQRWDVILMTPRGTKIVEKEPNSMTSHNFSRIIDSQTATGYIFKPHMIDILLENFIGSHEKILKGEAYIFSALDQNWKSLQKTHKFYYYNKICGGQLPGWSDLEKMHVNYNYGFLIQGQDFVEEDDIEDLVR